MSFDQAKLAVIALCFRALVVGVLAVNAHAEQPASAADPAKAVPAPPVPLSPEAQAALDKGIIAAKLDPPDYSLALRYFEEARKHAPDSPAVFFHLGLVESKMPGRELRAICWFAAYLAADPDAPNAAAVKEQIVALDVQSESDLRQTIALAQKVATQIPDIDKTKEDDRGWAQQTIAGLWCDVGDIATAQVLTGKIRGADCEAGALLSIARAQHDGADLSGAKKTLIAAKGAAVRMAAEPVHGIRSSKGASDEYLARIACLQAEYGDIPEAEKTIKLIATGNMYIRIECFLQLAEVIARSEIPAKAQEAISHAAELLHEFSAEGEASNHTRLVECYAWMAMVQAMVGNIADARATLAAAKTHADRIAAEYARGNEKVYYAGAYSTIAKALADLGDYEEALKMVELELLSGKYKESNLYRKISALVFVATKQLQAGEVERARTTFGTAQRDIGLFDSNDYFVDCLQSEFALFVATLGDYADARQIADRINSPLKKRLAQRGIAEIQVAKKALVAGTEWLSLLDDGNEHSACPLNTRPFLDMPSHLDSLQKSDGVEIKKLSEDLASLSENMLAARMFIRLMLKREGLSP